MRAVIQRVERAEVRVDGEVVGKIEAGLVVLLGVAKGDSEARADALAKKIVELRIFADDQGKMNRSLVDIAGGCLVVSQFTLFADCRRGRRPFFGDAEDPARACSLCDYFVESIQRLGISRVGTGQFGAMMKVDLCNDGPVTIILDSADLEGARAATA